MAFKSWLNHSATVMLFLICWGDCNGLTVDPPADLSVFDNGRLGYLDITWSPPSSLRYRTDCTTVYQLEYFNTYRGSWSTLRTGRRTYSAQFDLMKDIRVRVYTLLSGSCTNNSLLMSNYTEWIQKPPSTGVTGTEVHNFTCVYHNMEYVECKWRKDPKTLASAKLNLYFWHSGLDQAVECPQYIVSDGVRSGCYFTGKSLPEFTNINFCVNGSSQKPLFTLLQIQNHVKPAAADNLYVQICSDMQLEVHWESPGRVPIHCLEWEVEHIIDGKTPLIYTSDKTRVTLPSITTKERSCFRVRSKLHKYCADTGFWSEWSHPTCDPDITTSFCNLLSGSPAAITKPY
ncbi:interleukin-13 receptor subunit alpha-2 isoform X2 [Parambassis ranga]|uniref:Interleukin-13 receptor subunit alpha-2 isoform X2 n=1 Tax=Parambassis ranga TaxID=210632 RepID=A0A6P7JIN9_9TELE|nr:interleukin-13 receptor subunit alpha-2-like isoform X2 [Parambassis ranga]